MQGLIRFFAKEHLFGNLLTLLIVIIGTFSALRVRKEIFPKVDFNTTTVTAVLPGASPEQVETLMVNPIEEALREVDGLKKVFSTSTESTAVIIIQLDPDSRDADKTNRDIQLAVDRIEDWPDEAEKPIVKVIESGQQPIIEVTVGGNVSEFEIRKAAKEISDELSLLPEVARVGKKGYRKREYIIEISPAKMAARRVSIGQVIQSLKSRNISVPGGPLKNEKGAELLVRTDAEYKKPQDILKTIIVSNDEGYGTALGDIATVREGQEEPKLLYRSNGEPSINLTIIKKEKADALKLVDKVKSRVDELQKKMPDGIKIDYIQDLSVYLRNRLSVLESNVYTGLVLVILILSMFLPVRVALCVASGIPVAMLATIFTLGQMGYSINLLSLMGMIIVLGMLVDDAIVVSENIWRHVETEGPTVDAIVKGTYEVVPPVIASVMTTVLAFAPMMMMTGIFGKFIYEIPLVVILALVFSLFEAFIIMPSHFASWVAPYVKESKVSLSQDNLGPFEKLKQAYGRWVAWSVVRRYKVMGVLSIVFIATLFLASKTPFVLFPPAGIERFFIRVEASKDLSVRQMEDILKPIEKVVGSLPNTEVQDFASTVGILQMDANDPLSKRGPNYGQVLVELTPEKDRPRSVDAIIEDLRAKVGKPERVERVTFEIVRGGPPQGRPVSIDVKGQSFEDLEKVAVIVKERLSKIDGVIDIQDSRVDGKDQWNVLPRFLDASRLGLNAETIATSVRASFDGIVATSVRDFDEEIDIRVTLTEKQEHGRSQLSNLLVGNQFGNLIPLREVADFELSTTQNSIIHNNYKRVINVSADVELNKVTSNDVAKLMEPQFSEITKGFTGVTLALGGENEDTQESMASLVRAMGAAILLILFILIMTFKSLIQPVLIVSTIPIGFMGVVYAMNLHGRPLSFMAVLGMVALAGVIVNNSIVYLDFVNDLRRKGEEKMKSLVTAATTRLRPIILTTSTTIVGLMPTAYGDVIAKTFKVGGADPFVIPLALSLGWGLGLGSIINAFIFPSLVAVIDDAIVMGDKLGDKIGQVRANLWAKLFRA